MKNLQNNPGDLNKMKTDKKKTPLNMLMALSLLGLLPLLSSCEAIADIFKAGMGVGIFLVIAVVGIILFFVLRAGKK